MSRLDDVLTDIEVLSKRIPIEDATEHFQPLLKFERNLVLPIHRWVNFKEGFSSELVQALLKPHVTPHTRRLSFLDPFCGVGTSLLAVEELGSAFGIQHMILRGIEVNPYIHFVAATKLDWHRYNPAFFLRAGTVSTNGIALYRKPELPSLSTVQNSRFVTTAEVCRLVELREKIFLAAMNRPELRPLLLGLAIASERIIRLRKDGRALRYTPKPNVPSVDSAVTSSWHLMAEDLQNARSRPDVDYTVIRGDGRRCSDIFPRAKFDFILFSPPYLNNIDYTEVYKVEQWLLGFLTSPSEMVEQRRDTFRSHPSCVFPYFSDAKTGEVFEVLGPAFRRLVEYASETDRWRRRLFAGYFADILRTLRSCRKLIARSGRIFLVVGNSVHGSSAHPIPVATDLWIAHLATAADLAVGRIVVGRRLCRRKSSQTVLRESVIEMTPK